MRMLPFRSRPAFYAHKITALTVEQRFISLVGFHVHAHNIHLHASTIQFVTRADGDGGIVYRVERLRLSISAFVGRHGNLDRLFDKGTVEHRHRDKLALRAER